MRRGSDTGPKFFVRKRCRDGRRCRSGAHGRDAPAGPETLPQPAPKATLGRGVWSAC